MNMNVYLESFGEKIRDIRKEMQLTQNDVSELSGINMETLRRIENGKVIPKFETLDLLSSIYKKDINDLFLKYRVYNYSYYYEIENRIEAKLDRNDFKTLDIEIKELNILLKYINNSFYKSLITQLSLLTEAGILYSHMKKEDEAIGKLIEAMKITNPLFNLSDYSSFIYSSMELRILMNITAVSHLSNHTGKHIEIMEFCLKSADSNDEVYPKICGTLAGIYIQKKNFKKALELADSAIKACQKSRKLNSLNLLYYMKGTAEYILGMEEYRKSMDTAITLCEAFGHDGLREIIIDSYNNIENIEDFF